MTRDELIEYIKSKLKKKAVIFETGGIRPTNKLGESWIGKVCWQNSNEQQPSSKNGQPMIPIATIFIPESDYIPKALKDIKMINIFIDVDWWDYLDSDDLVDLFEIRTYESIDQIVPCNYLDKEQIEPFPLVPSFVDNEMPYWSDLYDIDHSMLTIISELENKKVLDYHADICESNAICHKIGGYPSSIQDGITFNEGFEFVLQISSDGKAGFNIVDDGNFYFGYNPTTKSWSVQCDFY